MLRQYFPLSLDTQIMDDKGKEDECGMDTSSVLCLCAAPFQLLFQLVINCFAKSHTIDREIWINIATKLHCPYTVVCELIMIP